MTKSTDPVEEVRAAVAAYDVALRRDDLDGVGRWFDLAPTTTRFGESGVVRGAGAIDAMRRSQAPGLATARVDGRADIWPVGEGVMIATLEFVRSDGSPGLRTQVWRRTDAGWRIAHAHLSRPG